MTVSALPPDDVLAFWQETYTTVGVWMLMARWANADEAERRRRMCLFARVPSGGT